MFGLISSLENTPYSLFWERLGTEGGNDRTYTAVVEIVGTQFAIDAWLRDEVIGDP